MLSLWVREDLRPMAMKGYAPFSKAPDGLSYPLDCLMSYQDIHLAGVLPICKDAVGVLHSPHSQPTGLYIHSVFIFTDLVKIGRHVSPPPIICYFLVIMMMFFHWFVKFFFLTFGFITDFQIS